MSEEKMTAVDYLRKYQKQIDEDGSEVGVSRQALDETLEYIQKLESALIKLRDCTWVITSPDCMDDVRDIADKALKGES